MKPLFIVGLTASLVLNATFGYAVLSRRDQQDSAAVALATTAESQAKTSAAQIWKSLASEDQSAEIARLKAAGFPPKVVRAIIAAQVDEKYAERRKALTAANANLPFWKTAGYDPKLQQALRQIGKEEEKELKALLGPDTDSADGNPFQHRTFSYLPDEKAEQLRQLLQSFDERRGELSSSGFYDRAKNRALDQEQHDAVARVLSADELLDYDLRTSNTATTVRERLSAFNPTEAEFRAIFQLQYAFDQQYQDQMFVGGPETPEMRARMDAQKQLAQNIKGVLTPDRAAAYDRMTDFNYIRTSQLIARLELPATTADTLYDLQQEYRQKQSEIYKAARGGSREAVAEQMTALQQEALARVTSVLGTSNAVTAYKQYGGQWLQSMVPRTPPSLTPPPAASPPPSSTPPKT